MNIYIDARMIRHTGIGTYIRSILTTLQNNPDMDQIVIGAHPSHLPDFESYPNFSVIHDSAPVYSFREQIQPLNLRATNIQLAHFPHFNIRVGIKAPYIVTIHDLIQFTFAYGNSMKRLIAKQVLKKAVFGARWIICVSQATRSDLLTMFPELDQEKITVIPNSAGLFPFPPDPSITATKDNYILCVGNRKPHKNFGIVIRAIAELRREFPDLRLILVGAKDKAIDEVDTQISRYQAESWVTQKESVSREKLQYFYRRAIATIVPSLAEGFGYPAFESLSLGTLPLLSDIPVFREYFGDRGIYFDPKSEESLVTRLQWMITHPEEGKDAVHELSPILDRFSARAFQQRMNRFYHQVLSDIQNES